MLSDRRRHAVKPVVKGKAVDAAGTFLKLLATPALQMIMPSGPMDEAERAPLVRPCSPFQVEGIKSQSLFTPASDQGYDAGSC